MGWIEPELEQVLGHWAKVDPRENKEARMELTLAWKGYGISLRVRRRHVEGMVGRVAKPMLRAPSPEQRREIENEYILASGNRYTAPTR